MQKKPVDVDELAAAAEAKVAKPDVAKVRFHTPLQSDGEAESSLICSDCLFIEVDPPAGLFPHANTAIVTSKRLQL